MGDDEGQKQRGEGKEMGEKGRGSRGLNGDVSPASEWNLDCYWWSQR